MKFARFQVVSNKALVNAFNMSLPALPLSDRSLRLGAGLGCYTSAVKQDVITSFCAKVVIFYEKKDFYACFLLIMDYDLLFRLK